MTLSVEELAAHVFATRNGAHLAHWKTTSYAQHMALGEFYEALPALIDEIMEVHFGQIEGKDIKPVRQVATPKPETIVDYIANEAKWIRQSRDSFSDNETIKALIDDLSACYDKCLYKLKRFSDETEDREEAAQGQDAGPEGQGARRQAQSVG